MGLDDKTLRLKIFRKKILAIKIFVETIKAGNIQEIIEIIEIIEIVKARFIEWKNTDASDMSVVKRLKNLYHSLVFI